jgi:hypothetical protein
MRLSGSIHIDYLQACTLDQTKHNKGQTHCTEASTQGGIWEGLYEPSLTPAKCNACKEIGSNPGPLGTSGDGFTTAPGLTPPNKHNNKSKKSSDRRFTFCMMIKTLDRLMQLKQS